MTDHHDDDSLLLALEKAETDCIALREENAALLERMTRAEKSEQSARACMAALLPDETLLALGRGKAIDDGEMDPATLLREENERLRSSIAELNDALDRAASENAALRAQNAYLAPRQRAGQLVANAMHAVDPVFYEAHRGDFTDPLNNDGRIEAYLRAWRESTAGVAVREAAVAYIAAVDKDRDTMRAYFDVADGEGDTVPAETRYRDAFRDRLSAMAALRKAVTT